MMKVVKKSTYEEHIKKAKEEAKEEIIEIIRKKFNETNSLDDFYAFLFDVNLSKKNNF